METIRITREDHSRSAEVFLVAGTESTYRIRVKRSPEIPDWVGGKILWGYDKHSQDEALAIARGWVDNAVLPPIHSLDFKLFPPSPPVDNYFTEVMAILRAEILSEGRTDPSDRLLTYYTLLVFTRGEDTTEADVHNAWTAFSVTAGRADSVPAAQLSESDLASDTPYVRAIHVTSRRIRGRT